MRPRTFILLILVLLVGAVAVGLFVLTQLGNGGGVGNLIPGGATPDTGVPQESEPGRPAQPAPTQTPTIRYMPVVVARLPLLAGQRLTEDMVTTELRPEENIVLAGSDSNQTVDQVVGRILKKDVPPGKEILNSFLALHPTDLASFGSDLSLYIEQGRVAVAFPINQFTGVAFAMRPGDQVDILMSLNLLELDEEFRTALPNHVARVNRFALEEGQSFLFPPEAEGRLELLSLVNQVAQISPQGGLAAVQLPRRATQLTLQQVQVVWMGSWRTPESGYYEQAFVAEAAGTSSAPGQANQAGAQDQPPADTGPMRERPEDYPDVVILGLTLQDALTLKWALEVGIDIHLVLRAQGDNSTFVTTSISLPQMAEQGGLAIPQLLPYGLDPRVDVVPTPHLPTPTPAAFP
jgi:Flp pilus assembly protein CpaB